MSIKPEPNSEQPTRVYVKICGITRLADAKLATELGADALGFVFYSQSPRNIEFATAAAIAATVPEHVAKVGVFVNPDQRFVHTAVESVGLDVIQLHGMKSPDALPQIPGIPIVLAVTVSPKGPDAMAAELIPLSEAVLLDAYHPDQHGGTGRVFDWRYAQLPLLTKPLILAGGLTPSNIRSAVENVQPYAVDVSTGVERSPGIKDADKLSRFFMKLKGFLYDQKQARPGFLQISR